MTCAAHPEATSAATCARCARAACAGCERFDTDGRVLCRDCADALARRDAIGSAAIAITAAAYLGALALGYVWFKARPYIGGIAVVAALFVGRAFQVLTRKLPVQPRSGDAPRVDA